MLTLEILWLLWSLTLGGDIVADPINPLRLTTSSALQSSRYTFKFHVPTRLLGLSELVIQFPPQYQQDLGVSNHTCFSQLLEVPVPVSCSVSKRTVAFQLPQLSAGLQVFGVHHVTNPQ